MALSQNTLSAPCQAAGFNGQRSAVPVLAKRVSRRADRLRLSAAAVSASTERDLQTAKARLLEAVRGTGRGRGVGRFQRGAIEELQVDVETFQAAQDLDYSKLGGLWLLEYTTASDVLPILEAEQRLVVPFFGPQLLSVGNIYQRFTSPDENGQGQVDNIIELSTPILEEKKGLTITVQASYEVRSGHRICLAFNAANVGQLRINEGFEALIAPAFLPRTPLQHALLMALRDFNIRVPFRSAAQVAAGVNNRRGSPQSAGGSYQLTYLDEDMLIGRASALGGSFVFTREK